MNKPIKDYKYVIEFFYEKKPFADYNILNNFYHNITNLFNISIDEINYSDYKSKTKFMKYTSKNIEKINNIYNDLISIGVKKFKEIKNYQDCQLDITYDIAFSDEVPGRIRIIIDCDLVNNKSIKDYFVEIIIILNEYQIKLVYGLSFVMKSSSEPLYFSSGIATGSMTPEQKEIAYSYNSMREYKNKIWDVFWLNIINKRIMDEVGIDKIIEIIGNENITLIKNFYLLALPTDESEYLRNEGYVIETKNKLRKVFNERNRIKYIY